MASATSVQGSERPIRLFVYDTLKRGEGNHGLMARARFVREARTEPTFQLRDLGGFPAMLPGRTVVTGEIYEVDAALLASIDSLEGHPVFFCRSPIVLADRSLVDAYLLDPREAAGALLIPSGDWHEKSFGTQRRCELPRSRSGHLNVVGGRGAMTSFGPTSRATGGVRCAPGAPARPWSGSECIADADCGRCFDELS